MWCDAIWMDFGRDGISIVYVIIRNDSIEKSLWMVFLFCVITKPHFGIEWRRPINGRLPNRFSNDETIVCCSIQEVSESIQLCISASRLRFRTELLVRLLQLPLLLLLLLSDLSWLLLICKSNGNKKLCRFYGISEQRHTKNHCQPASHCFLLLLRGLSAIRDELFVLRPFSLFAHGINKCDDRFNAFSIFVFVVSLLMQIGESIANARLQCHC